MKQIKIKIGCWLIILLTSTVTFAQKDSLKTNDPYIDQTDLMGLIRGKKKSALETGIPQEGKLIFFAAPIFGSNPSLGTFYGLGGTGAIFLGSPETTSISNMNASLLFTTKNQFIGTIKGTVMTNDNKWEMLIDIKYSDFSESTYGLGSDYNQPIKESWDIGGIQTAGLEGAQPMVFNQIKFYYTLLREIKDNFYLGLGYNLDVHYNIQDLSLDLDAPEPVITSHYAYSTKYGYDPTGYVSSGISLNAVFDSRDHTVNAYSGSFLQASYRADPQMLGNNRNYQQMYLEARILRVYRSASPVISSASGPLGNLLPQGKCHTCIYRQVVMICVTALEDTSPDASGGTLGLLLKQNTVFQLQKMDCLEAFFLVVSPPHPAMPLPLVRNHWTD